MIVQHMLRTAAVIGVFAIIGTTLVALTHHTTKERIAASERAYLLRSLHEVVTPEMHDNDFFKDTIEVVSKEYLGSTEPMTIYRARMKGLLVAVVLSVVAPDGYNGTIRMLVGVRRDGTLVGVRVVSHRETPGLGDDVEITRSDWILGFNGRSLGNPGPDGWMVKRDGGVFDQFTGATITPRAVVKAVYKSLLYYRLNREYLLTAPATESGIATQDRLVSGNMPASP